MSNKIKTYTSAILTVVCLFGAIKGLSMLQARQLQKGSLWLFSSVLVGLVAMVCFYYFRSRPYGKTSSQIEIETLAKMASDQKNRK